MPAWRSAPVRPGRPRNEPSERARSERGHRPTGSGRIDVRWSAATSSRRLGALGLSEIGSSATSAGSSGVATPRSASASSRRPSPRPLRAPRSRGDRPRSPRRPGRPREPAGSSGRAHSHRSIAAGAAAGLRAGCGMPSGALARPRSSGGSVTSHTPRITRGQRVLKTHPLGGLAGLGISPSRRMRRRSSPSTFGTADSSASVYGWFGPLNTASERPTSMIRPRYITAIRSAR